MPAILFKSVPFIKEEVTLALESGVDGIITDATHRESVAKLARCDVFTDIPRISLSCKEDELAAAERARLGEKIILSQGWEIIPVENLLAQSDVAGEVCLEISSVEQARTAAGILERGVDTFVILPEALPDIKKIVSELKVSQGQLVLNTAIITKVRPVGLGHRVCVDTLSMLHRGQGMLVGNSSAFTFLVHAETEHNDYVASRPFRINAGGVHSYIIQPHDRTAYASELTPGTEILIVDAEGKGSLTTVGRVKTEIRPMIFIEAEIENGDISGGIFLQNAETIRLVKPDCSPISVVDLHIGDQVLCRVDSAGRHFGMRIQETIKEN